ncbi:MAG: InlB B-repeat-containing protein [Paludibacteraceae bacterium]|nr:InlB B-repeat-containing protein [Paludibacteraceae bacterium]
MRSKIRKVTWLVWVLLMLPIGQALAVVYSGTSGGTDWRLDTNTGELTISKSERGNGITGNYHHTWFYPSDGSSRRSGDYQGEAPWRTYQRYITSLVVNEDVVGIGAAAFAGLENLTSVTLPNSLESISFEAFRACKKLDSIHLGPNVCTLGDRWLTGTYSSNYYNDRYATNGSRSTLDSIRVITVDPDNQCFVVDKYGVLYTKDMKTLVKIPQHLLIDEIVIPEGVTKIATDALYQQQYLKSIVLPTTLTDVQYAAFDGIPTLEKIWFNSTYAPEFEIGIGQSTNHDGTMLIYVPCDPDENLETRITEYGEQTGINVKNIQAFVNEYTIEAVVANSCLGKGTAQVTVRGVTCGDNTATIVATPYGGYHFLYWKRGSDGHEIGESTYTFTCTADETYTAYFSNNEYYLNVKAEDPAIATTTGSGRYDFEAEVQISATAKKDCYHFLRWDDDITDNPRTVVVDTAKLTYTAIFTKDQFIINGLTDPANGSLGTVSIVDANGNSISNGNKASCGDLLTFTATPAENCHFINWNNNSALTNKTIDTVVGGNISLKAFFAKDSFLVSFYNTDNTLLCQETYAFGDTPACDKAEDIETPEYTYEFKGWNPQVAPVSGEATYYAVYDTIANPFDFITVVEGNQTKTKYKFGESVATPANPNVKEGYVFNGWFDALRNGEEISFPFNMPAKDTIAYAVFTPDTFILTYKTFDSTTVITTQKYAFGEAVNMLPGREAPAREGYTFKNWSSTFQTMPARDTFVAAVYTVNTYHITFKDIDGTTLTEYDVQYGESVEDYSIDKEGYTCDGWLNNGQQVSFPFNMPAENVTLVANCSINTYSLSFWADPDTEEPIDVITDDFGAPIDATGIVKPEKTGHTFEGWDKEIPTTMPAENIDFIALWSINIHEVTFKKNENEIISSEFYEYGSEFNIPDDPDSVGHTFAGWDPEITSYLVPDQDLEFVAQWSVNSYDYIVIKDNGEKNDTISYPYGTTITLPSTPEKEGYTFLEWSDSTSVMPDHDVTTKAQWQVNTYNYTVIKNNGEDDETTPYNYGDEITLPSTPEQEGYTFLGWSDSTAVMPARNVTTEALWEINQYKVTFMKNENEVISSMDYDYGSIFEIPADPDSVGHTFMGWNPEITDAEVRDENLVFIAQWEVNKYNYTVIRNNGEENETVEYEYNEDIELPSAPEKEGYTFIGWSDSTSVMPAHDVTTEAQWKVNSYTLTFKDELSVDTIIKQTTVEYGKPVVAPQDPKKTGYSFVAWVDEDGSRLTSAVTMPASNMTYNATYKINSYIIKFVDGDGEVIVSDGHKYSDTLEFGSKIKVPSTVEPWNDEEFLNLWSPAFNADTTVPASNVTYVAQYNGEKVRVRFIDGRTYDVLDSMDYNTSAKVLEYTKDVPEHEGYTFSGEWELANNNPVTFPYQLHSQNVDFYSIYNKNYYKLTFLRDVNDTIDVLSVAYEDRFCGRETCLYPDTAYKKGYIFTGWSDSLDAMPAHDVTIMAQFSIISYNVTFENLATGEITVASYEYGSEVSAAEFSEDECYEYLNWSDQAENGQDVRFPFNIDQDTTVYLLNQLKQFTISFIDYDGAELYAGKQYGTQYLVNREGDELIHNYKSDNEDKSLSVDLIPSREGYTFIGWTSEYNDATTPAMANSLLLGVLMPCYDIEYKANYVIDTFNVYLAKDFDAGKPIFYDTISYVFNADVTEPERDSITGYHFNGWYTFPSYENVVFPFVMPAHDTIICLYQYSPNQHELTFKDYNDTTLKSTTLDYGTPISASSDSVAYAAIVPVPSREGYTFIGWDDEIPATMPDSDVVLTAQYEINSYPITFYFDKDSILYTDTIEYQSAISVPNVEREGYKFNGWDATIPGKMPADTLEFYAQFEAIPYTLTYVDFDRREIVKFEYIFGDEVSYPKEDPSRVGYTFVGWSDSLATMPAKNVTSQAKYSINQYTVSFMDINNEEISSITDDYGKVVTAPTAPAVEGHKFIGWDKEVPATIPDSNVVLNALYSINDYYVYFVDYDGDTLLVDTVPFGSDNIAYPADPKREGYDFVGYIEKVPTTMPAHDIIAKAQYVLLQYSVKFYDSFNNKLLSDFHENYGTPVVVPSVPKHEGYTFTGWSDTVPATVPAKNVKLTAQYAINEYVLTFKFKDSTIQKENVEYGADVVRPTFVPEVGYHFVEWSDKDTIQKMPAKNVTITAKVDADLHTITFRDYDSTLIRQVTSKYGSVLSTEDIIPSLKGYTFDKWSIDIPATMPAYDTVAYAEYVPNQYTITYKDYDQSIVRVDTFFYKDTIKAIEGPEREGYTFKGWKTIPTTMPIGGVEVTAQYKVNSYIISFRAMDSTKIETKSREFGSELVAPELPELEGYTTLGWDKEVPATVPAKNDTFYAQYQINTYSISFEDKEDGIVYKQDSLDYNSVIELPEEPTKEGYSFVGWDMNVPTNMPAVNIVTYAVWKANPYVLSFVDYNDSILDIDTLDFGAKVVYPADPVREGYNFVGWADSLLTMPAYNDSIIAQYQVKKYEVIFKDGDSIIFKDSLAYGDTIIAPADPEKKGYQFDGWNPEVPVTVPAYDIILTPTWTKAEFVITFLDYDSTVVAQDTLMFNANIVKPKVTREGYTFTGWNPEVPNKMPGADLTTIAEYTINKHEVIFVDGDDNIIYKDSLYFGDTIVVPADPTKEGYDFAGWDPEVPVTVPDEDLLITPVFTKAEFIITFLDFDSTEIFKDTLSYDSKIAVIKDPTREGYTFSGWNPVVPNKMPGENFTTIAEYTINSHIVTLLDDDDNILFRDTFVYGDSIKVDTVPSKDGFTFDGWNPVIPELAPDSDLTAHPTWVEDALVLDSVDAFADNFCAGDVARVYYSVSSGKPTSFTITFDDATTDAGFKTQTGTIGEDGEIFMTIPEGVEEGVYTATLQLTGVDSTSNAVDFKFATNLSSRYISRMWDDVVVCDNSDEEFESYQWYKNGEKIKGATKQFYCELGGLDGFYSVIVKTKDGKKKHICGIQCDYVLPPFTLIAYPNPAKANEQFTLEVKGLTEEQLKDAKISIFSVSGRVALTESDVEYKNLVSLPHGEYIALVTFEGKSAFCKIIVQ